MSATIINFIEARTRLRPDAAPIKTESVRARNTRTTLLYTLIAAERSAEGLSVNNGEIAQEIRRIIAWQDSKGA